MYDSLRPLIIKSFANIKAVSIMNNPQKEENILI